MSWQNNFAEHATRVAFNLTLTRQMIYFMEVIATTKGGHPASSDDYWDSFKRVAAGGPVGNQFVPGFHALRRRGLAEHNPVFQVGHKPSKKDDTSWVYRLTPAGEHVMELLRITGLVRPAVVANDTPARRKASS